MTQLPDYSHRTGSYARTTAAANVIRHRGIELTESMAFGLGGGLHFSYEHRRSVAAASRQFAGCAPDFEQTAAENLGFSLYQHELGDPDHVRQAFIDAMDRGYPVMVRCLRSKLPFVETADAVRGEPVVVVGYAADDDRVWLADYLHDDVQAVPFSTLQTAVFAEHGAWSLRWLEGDGRAPGEAEFGAGLDKMQANMEEGGGLEQLRAFADEVAGWGELADRASCFALAHDRIVGSTGSGSLYRELAREFVAECREQAPGIFGVQLGIGVTKCAQAWNTLADYLLAAADPDDGAGKDPLHHVESVAEAIYQYESALTDLIGFR